MRSGSERDLGQEGQEGGRGWKGRKGERAGNLCRARPSCPSCPACPSCPSLPSCPSSPQYVNPIPNEKRPFVDSSLLKYFVVSPNQRMSPPIWKFQLPYELDTLLMGMVTSTPISKKPKALSSRVIGCS